MERIIYILLVLYGVVMLMMCFLNYYTTFLEKNKKPKNKVHFYVARDKNGDLWLYIGKPFRIDNRFYSDSNKKVFCLTYCIEKFGLKHEDFDYLKWEDEPVEVFLNMED